MAAARAPIILAARRGWITNPTFRAAPIMPSPRRSVPLLAVLLGGCLGHRMDADVPVAPRLTVERLGDVKGSMTFDGDWVGGAPSPESAAASVDLAARRGVGLLVDLRSPGSRAAADLEALAREAGMAVVALDPSGADCSAGSMAPSDEEHGPGPTETVAVELRSVLAAPDRPAALVLDDDGALAVPLYGAYLVMDRGVPADEVGASLRAAGFSGVALEALLERLAGR